MSHVNYATDDIQNFFGRPILIDSRTWAVGSNLDFNIPAWRLYFQNAAVVKKLANYQWIRCNLNIRVLVNGTPFHFSRVLVANQPMFGRTNYHNPNISAPYTLQLMKTSMFNHVMIDPSENNPVELYLPYFHPRNLLSVDEMITNSGDSSLGLVWFKSTDVLRAASATATPQISVSTFAWASDVELVLPTDFVAQSGRVHDNKPKMHQTTIAGKNLGLFDDKTASVDQTNPSDEYKPDGLVSHWTSVAAKAAGMFEKAPLVGSMAKTVSAGLNTASDVARLFGFSRPNVLTDTGYVKRNPYANIANVEGNETAVKLAFDPKQAITTDPAMVYQDDVDELQISTIVSRECLITVLNWTPQQITDDEIFSMNVNPMMMAPNTPQSTGQWQLSPLAHASWPFKFWSGTINLRVQIVASQYHGGKIRIIYEPDGYDAPSPGYNTQYSQVMDLNGSRDVCFAIPWGQNVPYKEVPHGEVNNYVNALQVGPDTYDPRYNNGKIRVLVVNRLTSPDNIEPISINFYISGGDDFELTVPIQLETSGHINSFGDPQVGQSGMGSLTLTSDKVTYLFGSSISDDQLAEKRKVFTGEYYDNFRPLLKRYCNNLSLYYRDGTVPPNRKIVYFQIPKVPVIPTVADFGLRTGNLYYTSLGMNSNVKMTLWNWLAAGFMGWRGSLKWKLVYNVEGTNDMVVLTRAPYDDQDVDDLSTYVGAVSTNSTDQGAVATVMANNMGDTWEGAQLTHYNAQPSVEVDVPYYNNLRWSSCSPAALVGGDPTDNQTRNPMTLYVNNITGGERGYCNTYVATGEDFSFSNYLGPSLVSFNLVP